MNAVRVTSENAVFIRIQCDPGVWREIQDHFTFEVPGAKYTPAYKYGHWDGLLRLAKKGLLYAGLQKKLKGFCEERGYDLAGAYERGHAMDEDGLSKYLAGLNVPAQYDMRDYQRAALLHSINVGRALLLSPTASGKSPIIYTLARWHERTLIIVPTVNLVKQMIGDFRDYGYKGDVHGIQAGVSRDTDAPIVVSTWQSIAKEDPEWVQQFDCVIVDECHLAKAKTISSIMEAAVDVHARYGFTGTLDGTLTNEMVLEGLFGPVKKVITTLELMDKGTIARAKIEIPVLKHPEIIRRASRAMTYADEIKYLVTSAPRNRFITNLATAIKGNTLVLYTRVEQHGQVLYDMIRAANPDRPVHFVHGGVDADDREEVRRIIQESDDAIVCASFGVYQLGVNAPRLNNVVLASPYKSRIVVAQSIGRGLRLSKGKTTCAVYDVADDLSWKTHKNHTLRHCFERVKLYAAEGFDYQTFQVVLSEDK